MKNRKKLVSILAGIMAAVMLLSLLLSLVPAANAASSSEIKKQIQVMEQKRTELRKKMEEIEADISENDDEIAKMVAQKNAVDQEIGILYVEIDNINSQIGAYNLLIADKQDELDEAEAYYDDLSAKNKERVRTMEEEGEVSYWAVLFKANSFSDLLDRLNMIEEIAAADQRRLDALREAADAVAVAKDELQLEKDALEVTRAELAETEAELDAKRQEANDLILELVAQGAEFEELLHEAEDEEDLLDEDISDLEREYKEAKESEEEAYWAAYWATYVPPTTEAPTQADPTETTTSSGNTSSGTTTNSGTTSTPSSGEGWIVPCSYRLLTSPFGKRDAPTAGASTYHQGVDLAGPEGTPIRAARSGTVTAARFGNSGGFQVVINHGDGYGSIYMHMTHYVVGAGQKVSQGDIIGYMGSTGISTGSHLHFGITYNGKYVNPALYIPL